LLKEVTLEADKLLRQKEQIQRAQRKLYLTRQLAVTSLADNRTVLLSLLIKEEQATMFLQTAPPYKIKILENATAPKQPAEPRVLILLGLPIAVSLLIAFVLITFYVSLRME
jgi:hypothetical protein